MKAKIWFLELTSYLLAFLFLMAAGSKLADLKKFTWEINNQPFDNAYTPFLVIAVPVTELILVLCLLWPKFRLAGMYGSAILMTIFTIYIGLVTFNVYDRQPCGCAFGFDKLSWPQHLAMNAGLMVLSYTALYLLRYQNNIEKYN
jgi:putative oxidoreductase